MPWTSSEIQLKEVGTHTSNKYGTDDLVSLSKLFEYTPTRKDSDKYFRCIATIDESTRTTSTAVNEQLAISEQFRVEYPPVGLGTFHEVQRSGRQLTFTVTEGENAYISIDFEAEPLPNRGLYKNVYCLKIRIIDMDFTLNYVIYISFLHRSN